MNKFIGGISVLALILSFVGLVGGNQSAPSLGGITNYDTLYLAGTGTSLPTLAIGTSTPVATVGDVVVDGTGTTTLFVVSSTASRGSGIQLENSVGSTVCVTVNGTTVAAVAAACK